MDLLPKGRRIVNAYLRAETQGSAALVGLRTPPRVMVGRTMVCNVVGMLDGAGATYAGGAETLGCAGCAAGYDVGTAGGATTGGGEPAEG